MGAGGEADDCCTRDALVTQPKFYSLALSFTPHRASVLEKSD
jgi:hypothetical protein